MGKKPDIYGWKLLRLLPLLFLCQPLACGERNKPIGLKRIGMVTTTNYCLHGKKTASDRIVKPGDIALSHDLEKKYHLKFGDLIYLDGEKEPYVFVDRMPPEWKRHADLYSRSCKTAEEYGRRKRMLWFVRKP